MAKITTLEDAQKHGHDTRIVLTRVERKFCLCSFCKEATTIDFEVILWEFQWHNIQMGKYVWEPRTTYVQNGKEVQSTFIAKCPRCGAQKPKNSALKAEKIKVVQNHVCDDRCQKAHSDFCTCSCGAVNHGIKNKLPEALFV